MMAGRIDCYIHSDATTPNKSSCLVKVTCTTDFGARTKDFIEFTKLLSRYAHAAQSDNIFKIVELYPRVGLHLEELKTSLKEDVVIENIILLKL